jgi:hypothetical protein
MVCTKCSAGLSVMGTAFMPCAYKEEKLCCAMLCCAVLLMLAMLLQYWQHLSSNIHN